MNIVNTHIIGLPEVEAYFRDMRARVYAHMLRTRGWKYRSFLRYLRVFKYVAFAPVRGEFLESYYTMMRYLDDVVDGDIAPPQGYLSEADYIRSKIRFAENPSGPSDEIEYLMVYCFALGKRFGCDFSAETRDILESLLFDAERRGKLIVFPEKELAHHFHVLDIRGTIRATLKIFRDDPDKYVHLEPLGMACRYQFNIEDIDTDIAAGYVNIPTEDCARFGITAEDLKDPDSPHIKRWLKQHATDGLALLDEHHRILKKVPFTLLEKVVFRMVYERPARKTFMKTLTALT